MSPPKLQEDIRKISGESCKPFSDQDIVNDLRSQNIHREADSRKIQRDNENSASSRRKKYY